ncbi:ABC transporter family substrate-binding protein [Salininema proteolyticum]|uniref:ABC transporter family substrate-binding protein n=1 Tax=Salininema proteolyticum TaxID=1607685 RepID=A0ABV8U2S2_9ACTN
MTFKKRAFGGVAVATSAALVLSACGGGEETSTATANVGYEDCVDDPAGCNAGERAEGGEIEWGVSDAWSGWNDLRADANTAYLSQAIWPGRYDVGDFGPDEKFVYNDGWFEQEPEKTSDDPLTVKYTLKEGAGWSDGTPFSLDDAIFSWHHMSGNEDHCSAECQPASLDWGAQVDDMKEADDGKAIEVTYKDGYQTAEWMFKTLFTFPAHIVEDEGGFADWKDDPEVMGEASKWLNETAPTWSSGPFVPTDAKLGEYIEYEPNPEWKGSDQPTLDKLTIKAMPGGLSTIADAMRNGEIDGATPADFDVDNVEKLHDGSGYNWAVTDGGAWTHMDINTQSGQLQDIELRKAIFTAIDVENIIDRTLPDMGTERRGNHIFGPKSDNYKDHAGDANQGMGDVEGAKKILEDAGYTLDGDTLTDPDGEPVKFDFRAGADNKTRQQTGELVQAQLREIGIEVTLDPIPTGKLGEVLGNSEFDMVIFGWSGNPAFTLAPEQYWGEDSSSNFGQFGAEGLQDAIDKVTSTTDLGEAAEFANEADKIATEGAYSLALNTDPEVAMANDELVNVRPNGQSQQKSLYNVAQWGLAK